MRHIFNYSKVEIPEGESLIDQYNKLEKSLRETCMELGANCTKRGLYRYEMHHGMRMLTISLDVLATNLQDGAYNFSIEMYSPAGREYSFYKFVSLDLWEEVGPSPQQYEVGKLIAYWVGRMFPESHGIQK